MARYVDAEKLLSEYLDLAEHEFPTASGSLDEFLNSDIPNLIRNFNTEDVQPVVHGGWVGDEDYEHMYGYYEAYKCSTCGCGVGYRSLYPYCPECGTKMWNGVTEEERMRY